MARRITLKYPATCRECKAELPAGAEARYYGRGHVYGVDCHERRPRARDRQVARAVRREAEGASEGEVRSLLDPHGAYTSDGVKIGSSCGCEDYPCCGH